MESMRKIKDMVCAELDELAKKGKLTVQDLDIIYKLVVTKEKLLRTEQIEGDLGYSQDGGWTARGNYSRGRYPEQYSMTDMYRGNSYGMEPMDYSMRGNHYSMDEGRSMMSGRLSEMLNDPNLSQQEKNAIKRAMESMR